eukprot:Protomagalhaensia_wolfi_Nauph_80__3021@NODE_3096_length_890_cov_3881_743831_g2425_i0_p2_GENE_NODE_3096_length_890_cov_3881_743831_g2425_i0NODE_3096_length_890_cov_3881_743831_g2425_i0_p2_ORF_typecomplete_len118_score1_96Ribosomal_L3/PF00297_22/0_071_NODE_3096_length_890_cov_3881_743831_g2425_i0443796
MVRDAWSRTPRWRFSNTKPNHSLSDFLTKSGKLGSTPSRVLRDAGSQGQSGVLGRTIDGLVVMITSVLATINLATQVGSNVGAAPCHNIGSMVGRISSQNSWSGQNHDGGNQLHCVK